MDIKKKSCANKKLQTAFTKNHTGVSSTKAVTTNNIQDFDDMKHRLKKINNSLKHRPALISKKIQITIANRIIFIRIKISRPIIFSEPFHIYKNALSAPHKSSNNSF
jgi:hypothetical protein